MLDAGPPTFLQLPEVLLEGGKGEHPRTREKVFIEKNERFAKNAKNPYNDFMCFREITAVSTMHLNLLKWHLPSKVLVTEITLAPHPGDYALRKSPEGRLTFDEHCDAADRGYDGDFGPETDPTH